MKRIAQNAGTEYSSVCPWSADGSQFLLLRPTQVGGAFDHFALFTADGTFLQDLPIGASDEPRWDWPDPNVLYFHTGNQLKTYNTLTKKVAVEKEFPEYSVISGKGESDLSSDGDHLVLCGQRWEGEQLRDAETFVYELSTRRKGAVLDVSRGAESFYITKDNEVAVSWRGGGMELFDRQMRLSRVLASVNGHKCVTQDASGQAYMVWTNSNEPGADPACQNGIEKINLRTFERTCLLPLDWNLAVHISPAVGWVCVETYSMLGAPSVAYQGKLLKVPLDGSSITEICDHGSIIDPAWSGDDRYLAQPKATVSRDGRRVLFASNREAPDRPGYVDVFMADVPQAIPSPPGGSRTHGRPRPKNSSAS
jgi:hypothetical protein